MTEAAKKTIENETVDILYGFKNQENYKNHFDWNFETDGLKDILSEEDFALIEKQDSLYEKNLQLKEILQRYFSAENGGVNEQNQKLAEWIVKDWGGIHSVKDFDKINNDIKNFYDKNQSGKEKLDDIKLSSSISSRSKVLSFLSPDEYVICDSRNIFALNWLLFFAQLDSIFAQLGGDKIHLFTPLPSKNKIIIKYNFETIAYVFFEKEIAYTFTTYSEYCCLIKNLTKKLGFKKIYETEMLLSSFSVDKEHGIPAFVKEKIKECLLNDYKALRDKQEMK